MAQLAKRRHGLAIAALKRSRRWLVAEFMEPPEIAVEVLGGDRNRRKPLIWLWRLLTVWMCRAPADPLAGGAVDALVRDVERRCDGRIAAVGVGDEQGIAGDDRLQRLLHALCVESGQGLAERSAATRTGTRETAFAGLAAGAGAASVQLIRTEGLVRLASRQARSGAFGASEYAVLGATQRSAASRIVSPAPSRRAASHTR